MVIVNENSQFIQEYVRLVIISRNTIECSRHKIWVKDLLAVLEDYKDILRSEYSHMPLI